MTDALSWSVGLGLLAVTVVGTVELLVLTLAGALARRQRTVADLDRGAAPRLAVVVPAHDEATHIAVTVASLRACEGLTAADAIVVVADNCTDDTAAVAATAGARVLVRHDAERRGKGQALHWAFAQLLDDRFDAFAVVDADTVVEPTFVAAIRCAFAAGADAVQVCYLALPASDAPRARLLQIALAGINVVRPRGRDRLGMSAGIVGNGFALSRATLTAVPYLATSIVEDLEYHLRLVRAGCRVRFVDATTVRGEVAAGGGAAVTQRARWEGGRLRVAREHALPLLRDVVRGRLRLLEPLADLVLLPLAHHTSLLVLLLAWPWFPGRCYAAAALSVVALHVAAAAHASGLGVRAWSALARAPLYVLWKLRIVRHVVRAARPGAQWVRTDRKGD